MSSKLKVPKADGVFFALLLVFAAFFFFYKLGENHLIEYDEGIYGVVAQNILKTGDWVTLTWQNGVPWYDKGPLYFWLTAIALKVFGSTAFAIRFWSAVSGFGSVIIVYLLGKKLFNEKVGLLSGFVLASTTGYLYYGRLGMLDVPTAFFVALSVYCLFKGKEGLEGNRGKGWFAMAGVALAGGFLTRGFIGLLGLVSYFSFLLLNEFLSLSSSFVTSRYADRYTRMSILAKYLWSAFLLFFVFLIVAAPWHLLMYQRHGQEFLQTYFGHQMFSRFAGAIEGKIAPRWWYITVIKTQFRIWFVVLLAALPVSILAILGKLGRLGGLEKERKPLLLVLIWAILTFGIFTAAGSKLVWYIIPIYPPLSLFVGWFIWKAGETISFWQGRFGEFGLMCLVGLIGLFYNVRMWSRIKTEDFTKDQVAAIEFKTKVDPEVPFCCVDMGWSVCKFYAPGAKVFETPKDVLVPFLASNCKWAVVSRKEIEGKEGIRRIGEWGDVLLVTEDRSVKIGL